MSKLRRAIVWLILYTQVWTPVLAQALPIAVDRGAPGPRPVIGVSRGVPVVQIAPPSAGGVSDNRYTQFNVGASGAVLNNSGGASSTQLAGQIGGNPMLGNRHAATILNQVTAPNPSQLLGTLEVAGRRANVIVANPAGITCKGCGFLNAGRATLATGRPTVGPDGGIGLDVASGTLRVEGEGLLGSNLEQLDLMARSLEVRAGIWAGQLNVTAGAAHVDYGTGAVTARAGTGPAPALAVDTAALGGMYANSIRLIGTEAGVGVNVGGNLVALTGPLELNAAGDVTIASGGTLQSARELRVTAAGDLSVQGRAQAKASATLRAGGKASVSGEAWSDADLDIQAAGDLRLDGSALADGGALRLASGGDLWLAEGSRVWGRGVQATAGRGLSADGRIGAAGRLDISAGGDARIGAAGALDAMDTARLRADGDVTVAGQLRANGGAEVKAGGALRVQGLIGSAQGTLNLAAGQDLKLGERSHVWADGALDARAGNDIETGGTLAAGAAMTLAAGRDLRLGGTVAALGKRGPGKLAASSGRDLRVRQDAQVQAADTMDLVAGRDLAVAGTVTSIKALMLAAARNARVDGTAASDAALMLTARDITVGGQGRMLAGESLGLDAGKALVNNGLLASNGRAVLNAGATLTNTGKAMAGGDLDARAGQALDNAGRLVAGVDAKGKLSRPGSVMLSAQTIAHAGVTLAGKDVKVAAKALKLAGELSATGDASVEVDDELDNAGGLIEAGGMLAVSAAKLINRAAPPATDAPARGLQGKAVEIQADEVDNRGGLIHAAQDLKLRVRKLDNRADGELLAGRNNNLDVSGALTNDGLIDGAATDITAPELINRGRIYGDAVSIGAKSLLNDATAVIASRTDLDLGVTELTNREHALIYAARDLRIGGARDAKGRATGQAQSLLNASATIEAARDADISSVLLRNRNDRYASETVTVSSTPKVYYSPAGTTDMYDAQDHWLCDEVTPMCSKDPAWLNDDSERQFLLPSERYPADRYGPPFFYEEGMKDKSGRNVPIWLSHTPASDGCSGGDEGNCWPRPERFRYANDDSVWGTFGVTPPSGPMPKWNGPEEPCEWPAEACREQTERRRQYETAYAEFKARHLELDKHIRAFNRDFARRLVGNLTYYRVTETVTETRTTLSDPARILAGGAMRLNGEVINDKSRIAAGGDLAVEGPAVRNIGASGQRVVTREGTATYSRTRGDRRRETTVPYVATLSSESVEVPVGTVGGHAQVDLRGRAPAPVEVRSVSGSAGIPDSQLFTVDGRPDAPYLVATDKRFAGRDPAVSSDYLLELLRGAGAAGPDARFLTPSGQPRRLGDGLHEQQAVSDQILATTGQRFLENYGSQDAQYKALLAAGARFGREHGLKLGVALTEAQQRQLTTDLVWLVEQTVTLPDGTTRTVLAPKVYLLVREGDLKGDGTLMAGRTVRIAADGEVANSGTLAAREATVVGAGRIINQAGGTIQGRRVDLDARTDLSNVAARIQAGTATLRAGRDLALTSTAESEQHGNTWGTHVSGVARVDADRLAMQAGRDLSLTAAQVRVQDDARLEAGRDIRLDTLTERHGERIVADRRNRHDLDTRKEVGTTLAAGGNLTAVAGRDIDARAADVTAGKHLGVGAQRDINLRAGEQAGSARDESYYKTSGFFSSKTTHTIQSTDWTRAQGTTFTGETASLLAGRDLKLAGANAGAQQDLLLFGGRDVDIAAARNTQDDYDYRMVKKSGFGALGGLSIGTRRQTDAIDSKTALSAASTVGSVEGDTRIAAGDRLDIVASKVLAPQGSVSLSGKQVNIGAALDTSREREVHEIKQSGLSITASNPVIGAVQTGRRMTEAAGKVDNPVMQGLAGATTGLAAVNAYDALQQARGAPEASALQQAGGVSIQLSLGTSQSRSTTVRTTTRAAGSRIEADRDVRVIAQGAGRDADITVTGSTLSAGGNAMLQAEGDVLLQAASNTVEQKTDSRSSSASIGLGLGLGAVNSGVTLELGASASRGRADGRDQRATPSRVTAGDTLALQSGGDTTLHGASGAAQRIVVSAGDKLLLQSPQDSSQYQAQNRSAGIGASICLTGTCVSSISAKAGAGRMQSDFQAVSEQTGLRAGDGGFQIVVKRGATLIGSVIASGDQAVADALNQLNTGTLVAQDLENRADYNASQVALGGGVALGDGKAGINAPVALGAQGSASSTTQSAIGAGRIVIRDAAAQQDLTGMTPSQTIASLNRDTAGAHNALQPIFDKEKIEAGFEIASEASRQVGQLLANRAAEIDALERRSKDTSLSPAERIQAAKAYADLETQWGVNGTYRQLSTAILGAASGNVTGGASEFVRAAAVNYLQSLSAAKIKELSRHLGGEGSAGHAALHAVLGCAGAAAQQGSCAGGGVGALSGVVLNQLLEGTTDAETKKLSAGEKDARLNLANSIIAGIAAQIDPRAASSASVASRIESENNALYQNRDKVARMKAQLYQQLEQRCGSDNACYESGFQRADRMAAAYDVTLTLRHYPPMTREMADMLAQGVLDLAPGVSNISALYELVTGETATGDEANRYFAAMGIVPVVGGVLKKGAKAPQLFAAADQAIDVGKVGKAGSSSAKAARDLPQVTLNRLNGLAFERQVVEALAHVGATKNTQAITVPLANGAFVTTIPDLWGKKVGGVLEVKNVIDLSMSNQLRAQIEFASSVRQPLNLVVSPRTTNVSREVIERVQETGGGIFRYDPASGELTKFERL